MKKIFVKLAAILLTIIIACGSMTAFAQTPADIVWRFGDDEDWIYSYEGELPVDGSFVLPAVSGEKGVYLIMEAEESGYYKISVDADLWFGVQKKNDSGIYRDEISEMAREYGAPAYYYLEKGEYVVGFDLYENAELEVFADYVGEITSFEYDKTAFENLILGYHIFESIESPYLFEIDGFAVNFSLGDKKIYDYVAVNVFTDKLIKGENTVEIGLYGIPYRETATVSIIEVTDVIKSVEISNLENYACITRYYNGNVYAPQMSGETVTVTYADGTTETIEDFSGLYLLRKCGYHVETAYEETDGKWILTVYVAAQVMQQKDCTVLEASADENLNEYKNQIFNGIDYIIHWADYYIDDILNSASVGEAVSALVYAIKNTVSDIGYFLNIVFSQTSQFIGNLI